MKKIMVFILSIVVVLTTLTSISANYTDYNLELSLTMASDKMLSGQQNNLQLKVKTTGAQTTYTDVKITIESSSDTLVLYDKDQLDYLVLQYFDSYEILSNKLVLKKDIYDSGSFIDIPLFFTSKNGLTENNSNITFTAKFESNEYSHPEYASVVTNVSASSPLKVNKEFLASDVDTKFSVTGFYEQDTLWKTRALIDKQSYGQHYIKEGSKIILREVYHEALIYDGMHTGITPTSHDLASRTLVWEFDAPTYAMQDEALGSLWNQDLIVKYRVIDQPQNAPVIRNVNVDVSLSFTDITDEVNVDNDSKVISIYPKEPTIPNLKGSWNVFGTWGPINGQGDFGYKSTADMNIQPTVLETDNVTYAHRISSMYSGQYDGYKVFKFNYLIDDYLELNTLSVPTEYVYFPNTLNNQTQALEQYPEYDVYFLNKKVIMSPDGNNVLNEEDIIAHFKYGVDFDHGYKFTRDEILSQKNLPFDTHIAQVQYDYSNTGPGMFTHSGNLGENMFLYNFSINENWRDSSNYNPIDDRAKQTNDIMIYNEPVDDRKYDPKYYRKTLWDFREDTINGNNRCSTDQPQNQSSWIGPSGILVSCMYIPSKYNDPALPSGFQKEDVWSVNGPRSNYVTGLENEKHPTVTNTIELLKHTNGNVYEGNNTLKLTVRNHKDVTVTGIKPGGINSYIAIPKSVDLDLSSVNAYDSKNNIVPVTIKKIDYTDNNLEYYLVEWDKGRLEPIFVDTEFTLEVEVNVLNTYQELNMHIFTDLVNDDIFNTLVVTDPKITDTTIIDDTLDLSGNGLDYKLLKSSNHYQITSDFSFETKKLVKGELDSAYSSSGKTPIDGKVNYKLIFTNKEGRDIEHFTLVDVLPTIGDLGITDSVNRGSQFGLVLDGPVTVSDKLDVYYSTSSNPKRDDLNAQLLSDGFDPIINPVDAEDPNWLSESEVLDFNEIKSFMIQLKENNVLNNREITEVNFTTIVDKDDYSVVEALGYGAIAWNSFALTIDKKPTVEPLQVKVTYEEETEYTDFTVYKLWENTDKTEAVTINLLRNGVVFDTVILDGGEKEGFTHTWTNLLKFDEDKILYKYTVEEVDVDEKYAVSVDENVITNTLREDPTTTVKTGIKHGSAYVAYVAILVSSLVLIKSLRKKRIN